MTENRGDLISREALKEHKFVGNKFVQIGDRNNGKTLESINRAYQQGWNDCIDAIIDNAPTVTPDKIQAIMSDYLVYRCEPQRPQGEWVTFDELRGWLTAQGFSSGTVEDKIKEFKRYIERSREDE